MKKIILTLAFVAVLLAGCSSSKTLCFAKNSQQAAVSDNERAEISWNAFCDAHGYDRNDNTYQATNEYLDTWCGSVAEEAAFIKAGVEPY